jgi:hypothetical protein
MRPPRLGSRIVLLSCMTALLAMPSWADTLFLRNGTSVSGTLVNASSSMVTFRGRDGRSRRYSVNEVDSLQFGDASYQSQNRGYPAPPPGPPPGYDNRGGDPGRGYGNQDYQQQGYGNNGADAYDQAHMERVIVPAGAEIHVRTDQRIDSRQANVGQTYDAQIDDDVRGTDGSVAIPRGSNVSLVTRQVENNGDITLDIDSVTVEGRRYRVSTVDKELESGSGIGANKRTGEYVGGGAVLGAIIGAIAGGGKGAAIGAVAGGGGGAVAQVITRGKEVHVPAETELRFRLDRPLRLRLWTQ